MNTRKIIEGIRERMHDPSYVSALKNEYAAQVKDSSRALPSLPDPEPRRHRSDPFWK